MPSSVSPTLDSDTVEVFAVFARHLDLEDPVDDAIVKLAEAGDETAIAKIERLAG